MLRHEKVAERAGSLVTERVRGLMEGAQGRAETIRRDAADEAHRLDSQRIQAASRIVAEIEGLEVALGRLRRQMQSGHAVGGSFVDEERLIEAAPESEAEPQVALAETVVEEAPSAATTVAAEVQDPVAEPESAAPGEEKDGAKKEPESESEQKLDDVSGPGPSQASQAGDPQATRFTFLRRRERVEESSEDVQEKSPEAAGQEQPHACAVCGRGFAGDGEDLRSLGWVISDSGDVTCADCHNAGWLRPSV